MGKLSRTKGHSFEREIAREFQGIGFGDARRQLEYHSRDAKGIDLQGTDHYKIQCKKCKNYVSINTIEEIECDRDAGDIPILITAADRKEPMAVLPWSDLRAMIRALKKLS